MIMPVIALRNLTVLPGMTVSFDISRAKSIAAVEKAMVTDQRVCLIAQRDPNERDPDINQLYHFGTVVCLKQLMKIPGNAVRIMAEGKERAELMYLESEDTMLIGEVEPREQVNDAEYPVVEAMTRVLREQLQVYGMQHIKLAKEVLPGILETDEIGTLMHNIASQLPWDYLIRQQYLEANNYTDMFRALVFGLSNEIEISKIRSEFQEKVKEGIDKNQREYILREQMRVIREELGEDVISESEEFEERVKSLKASKEVKEKLLKEISRFASMPAASQDGSVLRTYVETLLELPWDKVSKENQDIAGAKKILEEDHYGLEKVKERILDYLAVRILLKKPTGSILCLVGPPGTGKTSVAQSVARALNKKYVRISLGGVRDEAEIRGHRKTYVGAMPGRIVEGLRQAGVSNPLMVLDEIDKVGSDHRGDTASALLEVLDSEQNFKFRDHYVELPVNLSRVLFIATANTTQPIPRPLLDRMEIIEINSYTENEKFHIGRDYLVAKQLGKNGLNGQRLTITDGALKRIIHSYTREAGVRGLERCIGDICRKSAREYLEKKWESVQVTEEMLEKYLGKEKFFSDPANEEDQVGIVRGLAWTSVGGDTLQIEVNSMPGKGKLKMTGQLGEVMKESAQIALTFVRSVCPSYQVEEDYFEKHDLHIHIPEGAVPKDGPSAGITMATAMLSAVSGRKVNAKVAMTGEITLRGRVLPIGGLKEKILAASQAKMETVLVPEKNRPDIEELSEEITGGLRIVYVATMDEVLKEAFVYDNQESRA